MTAKDQFLSYLRDEQRRSEKTLESYDRDLQDFETYCSALDETLTWATVDSDVIRGWMESMMDRGNAATSINRRLSALRSFYRFALAHKLVERDPAKRIEGPKRSKPLPHFVKESEIDQLLDQQEWGVDYESTLARTIIMTFYETGVRLAELVALDDVDIDYSSRQMRVTGKGSKQRLVPFGEELGRTLRIYVAQRNSEVERQCKALFADRKGRRISRDKVSNIVKSNLARVSTQKKLSPHVLRHSFATAMLNHGAGIESVRRLLGHESVQTTEIYTHTTFEQLKRVYEGSHPRESEH